MLEKKEKTTIGRAERVSFAELDVSEVPARIDTGAGISAISITSVEETPAGGLDVVFFDDKQPFFSGNVHHFSSFSQTEVRSSNGLSQVRYTVRLQVKLGGRKVRATFTLADRSTQLYPVLIGRNILRGKFIVDVKQGVTLRAERERLAALQQKYSESKEK